MKLPVKINSITYRAGFSILELLLVLVILGIFAAVAIPATGRLLNSIHFRQQTQKIMSTFRYARLMSISRGGEVRVTLDESDGTMFRLTGAIEENRNFQLSDEDSVVMEPAEIVFYPESLATPVSLIVTLGKRTRKITIDPLTALPLLQ